ncbi:MAG: alpha-glucosidase C-terminal domain-containing protein [Candidatus Diapherotrites archaeon]|nr:alpha-glucosidase C-terminal domain-containing protein [Candidatus Diapherotrites archaeon]
MDRKILIGVGIVAIAVILLAGCIQKPKLTTTTTIISTECGNNICETGEDGFNCPKDCCISGDNKCLTGCTPANDDDCKTPEVKVETICTDGIDNDGDGLTDNDDGDCWIREGATFCEELVVKTATFEELNDIVSILKDTGVNLIELTPIWEHCNSKTPGFRWQISNYDNLDPARGTEAELSTFLTEAHSNGLKVITMFETATTAPQLPACQGRVASWSTGIDYDRDRVGGFLYQYQVANKEKDILIKNLDGEYACEFSGHGLFINPKNEDVIKIFKELYDKEINKRGFDGMRIDHPAINPCFAEDTTWHICNKETCPDPVIFGDYSPMDLYRELRKLTKPNQIYTSEGISTNPHASDWACKYPYYRTSTEMDEIAEISEDYLFIKLINEQVITNNLNSKDFVLWFKNEPINYNRTRYRMLRNWNLFGHSIINFILNDPKYLLTVTLLSTIPGVPKVSQFEIIEEPPSEMLDELNIQSIKYPVNIRRSHWKKVLNIRNNNNALKYGTLENVWKSGDNTYAYSRTYEDENVVVVINFNDKQATSILDIPFKKRDKLKDELSGETFTVADPADFRISVPAYGSRVLILK